MLTIEEARTRVARGAAHLDVVRPGWHNRIDVGTLTLHDPCGCIVGQLCARGALGFYRGLKDVLGPVAIEARSVDHGFELSDDEYEGLEETKHGDPRRRVVFQPLQDAWIEAIADRRLREAPVSVDARLTPVAVGEAIGSATDRSSSSSSLPRTAKA